MAKHKRKPRPTVVPNLPATFEQGQAAEVIAELDRFAGMVAPAFTSAAGRDLMRGHLIRLLRTGDSFDTANIIAMADKGHTPAIEALRIAIGLYLDQGGRWENLLKQVQGWDIKMRLQPVLPGYPHGRHLLVDSFARDMTVTCMMTAAIERFSLPRRQAAKCVGEVCHRRGVKLKRQQIERIYRERNSLSQQLAAFMLKNMQP